MSITLRDLTVEEGELSGPQRDTIIKLQGLSKQSDNLKATLQDVSLLYRHYEQALYASVVESREATHDDVEDTPLELDVGTKED